MNSQRLSPTQVIDSEKTKAHLEAFVNDAGDLVKNTVQYSEKQLEQKLDSASDTLKNAQKAIKQTYQQSATAAEGIVRENPWKALGGALLIGVIGISVLRMFFSKQ